MDFILGTTQYVSQETPDLTGRGQSSHPVKTAESTKRKLPRGEDATENYIPSISKSINKMRISHKTNDIDPVVRTTLQQLIIYGEPLPSLTKEQWIEVMHLCGAIIPDKDTMCAKEEKVVTELINNAPDSTSYAEIIARWPLFISKIPVECITDEMWITAIKRNPEEIYSVPEVNQTSEMWILAIKGKSSLKMELPLFLTNDWNVWEAILPENPELIRAMPNTIKKRSPEKYQQLVVNMFLKDAVYQDLLDENIKTDKLWELACSYNARNIRYFQDDRIEANVDFYQKLCQVVCDNANRDTLKYIRFNVFKEEVKIDLCERAINKSWYEYKNIPEHLRINKSLAIQACRQEGSLYNNLHHELQYDWEVCKVALLNCAGIIEEIPEELLERNSKELCILFKTIVKCDGLAIGYFPIALRKKYNRKYRELCDLACQSDYQALTVIPKKYQTRERFLKAFDANYEAIIIFNDMPKVFKESIDYDDFIKKAFAKNWLPDLHQITLSESILCCQQTPKAIIFISERFQKEVLKQCPDSQYYLPLASPHLSVESAKRLSLLTIGNRNHLFFYHPFKNNIKKALLDSILRPVAPSFIPTANQELYKPVSPFNSWRTENPYLEELLFACYTNATFTPPDIDISKQLMEALHQAVPIFSPSSNEEALLTEPLEICGGRTARIASGSQGNELLQHYKFHRKGEPLDTLSREGLTHQFFEKMNEGSPASVKPFKSQWPEDHRFIRLSLNQLPCDLIDHFDDKVEITTDQNGERFVNIYCYKARREYSDYAHTPDDNSNPFYRAEQGLLKASHDIGRGARMGLLFTSTLPAFHDTKSNRRWIMLHSMLGYICRPAGSIHLELPGTLGAWNSVATERADFGYDGLRDIGDFEFFAKIKEFFKIKDVYAYSHPPQVMQRIIMANTLCENMLAVCLMYARLHHNSSDYHYCNPGAVTAAGQFIEEAANEMLEGLLPRDRRCQLQTLMKLNNEEYAKWLNRAVEEMLYFTAQQPATKKARASFISSTENNPAAPPVSNPANCYAHHISENWRFCEKLYPDDTPCKKLFPEDFTNPFGKQNLGLNASILPLTTLVKGLVRMCTGYFLPSVVPDVSTSMDELD
ncbi:hypothetical protein [Endozoicomonas sp.]|uniref:hypothetical protein n=1 Tax=Endozoicomonas sp. TaxID=1892382 RepID=UPI0028878814|nr:DUF4116 domain-containing protein [Endozoicomonas sp.]